nr:hypothetical protein [Pedobacter glucosidilyticus]
MKLTITGTSGFAGQNLVTYLAEHNLRKLSIRYVPNQEIYLDNAEAIIHLAGKAHDLKKLLKQFIFL